MSLEEMLEGREVHTCHHLESSHTDVILCHFLEELVWQAKISEVLEPEAPELPVFCLLL